MSGSATITAGTPPTAFAVTGGGSFCSGPGLPVGLSGSQSGVTYQLILNGSTNVGAALAGNGNALSFGNQTAVGYIYRYRDQSLNRMHKHNVG